MMQVKLLESDTINQLMEEANTFLAGIDERDVVSVNYQCNVSFSAEEQLDLYSLMITYCVTKPEVRKAR